MVDPSAERNGPLLERTPARKSFPRIQDAGRVAAHGSAEPLRQGGDPGQVLKKVQSDPFCLQDGPPVALDIQDYLSIFSSLAVMFGNRQPQRRIDHEKGLNRWGHPRHDQRLLCDDLGQSRHRG